MGILIWDYYVMANQWQIVGIFIMGDDQRDIII